MWLSVPSKITIDRPAAMEETKKSTGRNDEYHSGCSLLGAMRNSAPSEDWCMVESTTPRMASGMVAYRMPLRILNMYGRRRISLVGACFMPSSHSRAAGSHSMNSTVT